MTTRYFTADYDGRTYYRSSATRAYVCMSLPGENWHMASRNARGPVVVTVREISRTDYVAAQRAKAAAKPLHSKIEMAKWLVGRAGRDQAGAGEEIQAIQRAMLGLNDGAWNWLISAEARQPGYLADRLVVRQRDQANAYKRMVMRRKQLDSLT
jgi:hypothetical protein